MPKASVAVQEFDEHAESGSADTRHFRENATALPPLSATDVRAALRLFMGSEQPSAKQIKRFVGKDAATMLVKLLSSDSLRGSTWPALVTGYDSPRRRDERLTITAGAADRICQLLGLGLSIAEGEAPDGEGWNPFLRKFFTDPRVVERLRRTPGNEQALDQLDSINLAAGMSSDCAFLHIVLLGEVHPTPFAGPDASIEAEAFAILTSDLFRETVLGPLEHTGRVPHERLWTKAVRWPFRAHAERLLLPTLDMAKSTRGDNWARFLIRLLRHEDSLPTRLLSGGGAVLEPLGSGSDGAVDAVQSRCAELEQLATSARASIEAACNAHARRDAVVGVPLFFAAPQTEIVSALHRLCLLVEPMPTQVATASRQSYDRIVWQLVASEHFRTAVLDRLRAGLLPEYVVSDTVLGDSLALLLPLFGLLSSQLAADARTSPRELARRLFMHPNFAALVCSQAPETPIESYVQEAFTALSCLTGEAGGPLAVRVGFSYGVDFVISVSSELPGQRFVQLRLAGAEPFTARPLELDAQGASSCTIAIPSEVLEQHQWLLSGHLVLTSAENEAEPFTVPLFHSVSETALREAGEADLREFKRVFDRAVWQAQRGLGDPVDSLETLISQRGPLAVLLAMLSDLLATRGEHDAAEAALERVREPDPELGRIQMIRARLAIARGHFGEAVERFEAAATTAPLDVLDQTLMSAALLASGQTRSPDSFGGEPLPAWFVEQLLTHIIRPQPDLEWFRLGTRRLDQAAVTKIVFHLVSAMAAIYQPSATTGTTLATLERMKLAEPAKLYNTANKQQTAHRLLGPLSFAQPDGFTDLRLLITLAKEAQRRGDRECALAFAEQAVQRDGKNHEALVLAANLHRQIKHTEEAIEHYRRALTVKPDDLRVMERLIELETDAVTRNPLRDRGHLNSLLHRHLERCERLIFSQPTNHEARLTFARACISLRRYDDARAILMALPENATEPGRRLSELLRVAVQTGDHAGTIELSEKMLTEEFSERAMMAAARAMRALGRFEDAQALLQDYLHIDNAAVRREFVRGRFYVADFEAAARQADEFLELQPADLELRLLAAAAYLELGQTKLAGYHIYHAELNGGAEAYPLDMPLFSCALAARGGRFDDSIRQLDRIFALLDVQPVRYDTSLGAKPFDQLVGAGRIDGAPPAPSLPLVSVIMTTFNAQAYVGTAIRSILSQTYHNIELIIVDDASTDATPAILQTFERRDSRVRVILKTTNDGTYVSKNIGLLQARGEFVALQDCDDWSHPERIEKSVRTLMEHRELMGLTTDWVRMTTDGEVVIKAGGQIAHLCCISLVFRRVPVLQKLGSFDSVRIAADLEFIQRMTLVFGPEAVPRLRWPLLFGRARSDSLTASEEFGLSRLGFSAPRQAYHEHSEVFHERIRDGAPAAIAFPLVQRPFPAPEIILPSPVISE